MPNNLVFKKDNIIDFKGYDNKTNTLVIKDVKDEIYHITFDSYIPSNMSIIVINSTVSIIENYIGNVNNCEFIIEIDENSKLNRFSILVDNKKELKLVRNINNKGIYESMQIDLNKHNTDSIENVNLIAKEATGSVIDGIYAVDKAKKTYQTNLNHYESNCNSKAQIFAINNDFAHVSINTDAYIKNGAIRSISNQEGRIINLSNTCSGIVLPNLHIDENDVEASHSCSVGSLNLDHMYYLQSRGLSELQSRNILIKGYFNPILKNIEDEQIVELLDKVLQQRIG